MTPLNFYLLSLLFAAERAFNFYGTNDDSFSVAFASPSPVVVGENEFSRLDKRQRLLGAIKKCRSHAQCLSSKDKYGDENQVGMKELSK